MTVNVYRSSDRDAPSISGQLGSMLAAMNEVLVRGYPRQTAVSVTRTGSIATVNKVGHKYINGQKVSISGAVEPEYNGTVKITYIDADNFSYPVSGSPSFPASGTILCGGEVTVGVTTLSRAGSTVTAYLVGHGFAAGQRVRVVGAIEPQYNGIQKITTVADADHYTYDLPAGYAPATTATGTILTRYGVAGAGWTEEFADTNRKAWKQGVKGTKSRMYLRCDESNATQHTQSVQFMLVDSMSGLDTLTDPAYPDYNPQNVGIWKSGTADATVRDWVFAADHRTIIALNRPEISGSTYAQTDWMFAFFGDTIDYVPDHNYPQASCCGLHAGSSGYHLTVSLALADYCSYDAYGSVALINNLSKTGGWTDNGYPWRMMRGQDGSSGIKIARIIDPMGYKLSMSGAPGTYNAIGAFVDGGGGTSLNIDVYPDPVHGGINMNRLNIVTATTGLGTGADIVRGEIKGVWGASHRRIAGWASGDTFKGSGPLSGKEFEVFLLNGPYYPWLLLEISDTWDE